MASDSLPPSPIDPHHPLSNLQRQHANLNHQIQQALGASSGAEKINRVRHMPAFPSQLHLSDIPIRDAPSFDQPLTPISLWLQTVEPVTPRSHQAYGAASYWSSDSDISIESESVYSTCADRDNESPIQTLKTFDFNRRGDYSPDGISPTNPGYRAADVQPVPGPSTTRPLPPVAPGKKKHCASAHIPCRVAVVIPITKLRPAKLAAKKPQASPHRPSASSLPLRPYEQPIYCCPVCGYQLPLLSAMRHHLSQAHPHHYISSLDRQEGSQPSPADK
ncbi:hypothetical protein PTTG_04946 [Puccinia triticina 1-1 BBBD Race 1]|uniref:C2H2-type domain-containing protein n=1 Tax=Puccinia triticina (isolate 1-1 / race 1 (BBBD)) TaxID=630390 RepID=A0A0C4EVW0_PUCT1|nr:hypothetical protein PTTG_04946 [Puccinia triticina 1-1 BBBD Race 1]